MQIQVLGPSQGWSLGSKTWYPREWIPNGDSVIIHWGRSFFNGHNDVAGVGGIGSEENTGIQRPMILDILILKCEESPTQWRVFS